ncbi:MoxR-like ATPase [Arthrobacter stackebrandtii]|uniref:MoxR-like ATPase n=1 Tax=Arthrobacter stackebrandtii TaxID=272161 RepID=A0ABS4YUR2_9MICC|nr:AAA family ATPase [Arthrobacter stackebrandtii]MBP2412152.1 MoxR-like ATPase [Arthrobacter stackebrandtii]PYH01948.1 AAA family ATPase [Arthrobacter stackebrandtii]
MNQVTAQRQINPPEASYATELAFLKAYDGGPRPPGWQLTPAAVVTFILGSSSALSLPKTALTQAEVSSGAVPQRLAITPKYVGSASLVERCVVTLAGERGLMLVGEPGTAKSMLSELLAAAVCGTSQLTVQGTAGTTEDQLRYGWNYALLLAKGPSPEALVPSPVMTAMTTGAVARIEEITRCQPEVQDALVSLLSERRIFVPELGEATYAVPGFALIATANLRDRGVSDMSAALKRRFNFEVVDPIAELAHEIALVSAQTTQALRRAGSTLTPDAVVIETLVTAFRDLRQGRTVEGWPVEKPSTVLSTAEAVSVSTSIALMGGYFGAGRDPLDLIPGHLLGVVRKDDENDAVRLLGYWDAAVRRRAESGTRTWARMWELRDELQA